MVPSSSRSWRRGLPWRKAARATRAVSSGTGWITAGLSDMAGLRRGGPAAGYPPTQAQPTSPTVSVRFQVAPTSIDNQLESVESATLVGASVRIAAKYLALACGVVVGLAG